MSNLKTYVLILSEYFPQTSKRAGQKTFFVNAFLSGKKKHTIRGNFPLWLSRFAEIEAGKAQLSVRVWTGQPYKSKQHIIKNLRKTDGIGLSRIRKSNLDDCSFIVDGTHYVSDHFVATNDHLDLELFRDWFKHPKYNTDLALIHFDAFRYDGDYL